MKDWFLLQLAPRLAAALIKLLWRSLRCDVAGLEGVQALWAQGERVIIAFWHDQLLMMAPAYCGPGTKILISRSRDGELIARVMARFGQGSVRGSSSRGGREALQELIALGSEPCDLVITPDGPKGPRHQAKPGVAQLARVTGRAVVPLAFVASRGHRFASWDRFLLPFPGARALVRWGDPLRPAPRETAEEFRARVEAALRENETQARNLLEKRGVSAV